MRPANVNEKGKPKADQRRPEPIPQPPQMEPRAGSLAWASAVGNQAVQRLARQQAEPTETEEQAPATDAAPVEEAEAPIAGASLPPEHAAALADVDDDAETLPQ